jgi:molybdopterin/thiamine biosynthesis adenylyltransferase
MTRLEAARVLLVGAGGLGSPAGIVLARSSIGHITVIDDDTVDQSNLHRQVLFGDADVGLSKAALAADRLEQEAQRCGKRLTSVARESRVLPASAIEIVNDFDLVVEGADNFATKFLLADACAIAKVPLVQAGAVRWVGWAFASVPGRGPCLRCVFEDVPRDQPETCAEAGVVGPVVGAMGALQAALAIRILLGDLSAAGELWSYRALAGQLRHRSVGSNPSCPLCRGELTGTPAERYAPASCAA